MFAGVSRKRQYLGAVAVTLAIWLQCNAAQAYIDPGVTVLMMQWIFTAVFGTIGAWLVAPWKLIKQMFTRRQQGEDKPAPRRDA